MWRLDHEKPCHLCLRVIYIQKARGAFKVFWDIDFILGNIELKCSGKYIKTGCDLKRELLYVSKMAD